MEGVRLVTNTSTRGIPKAVIPDNKLYVMEPKLEHSALGAPPSSSLSVTADLGC